MKSNSRFLSYLSQFISEKEIFQTNVVENINIRILCWVIFENYSIYEIMWKNIVEMDRSQMTIWRMRMAWWIPHTQNI